MLPVDKDPVHKDEVDLSTQLNLLKAGVQGSSAFKEPVIIFLQQGKRGMSKTPYT